MTVFSPHTVWLHPSRLFRRVRSEQLWHASVGHRVQRGAVSPDCDKTRGPRLLPSLPQQQITAQPSLRKLWSHTHKVQAANECLHAFAKKYRVEYTQMYPGKDNRCVDVPRADRWMFALAMLQNLFFLLIEIK